MKIAIFTQQTDIFKDFQLGDWLYKLIEQGFVLSFYEKIEVEGLKINFTSFENSVPQDTDLILTLGGDGTFLKSVKFSQNGTIPILGVNIGRLGFLTSTNIEDSIQLLNSYVKGDVKIDEKPLLELISPEGIFEYSKALNDITVLKTQSSSMIKIKAFVNKKLLNIYWADGLIVSTSTGSSAYSLSCGGPIVSPGNDVFVITPISSHNLNARPIIIPDTSEIKIEVESRTQNFMLSLDSESTALETQNQVVIRKSKNKIKVIRPTGYDYFENLRNKMLWGLDNRN